MPTPEQLATDPAVRAAVLASVTIEEAHRILRTRAGKPWCDAFLLHLGDGLSGDEDIAGELGDGVRKVVGVPQTFGR